MKKKIFITGSGSGLGKCATIELAKRGHKIYSSTQFDEQAEQLNEYAKQNNLDIQAFKLDILNNEERQLILNYDIDVFISNAAIGDSGSVSEIHVDRIRKVFETNVFCNIEVIQLVLKNMIVNKKQGRIVMISSLVGRIPFAFLSPYCASKGAIEIFGECLRKEIKKLKNTNIKIILIEPGAYKTGFNKENVEKKYEWMVENSYFKNQIDNIHEKEIIKWKLLELKNFNSIVKRYIKAVECKHPKFRYQAPWWQAMGIQILRIFGK